MKEKISLKEEKARDNRIVTGWLLYYHERKNEYKQRRDAILQSSSASAFSDAPGRPYMSDVTGRKATKLAALEKTERWLAFVEEIEQRLPPKMQVILLMRREYRYSKRGDGYWRERVEERYRKELAAISGKREEDVGIKDWEIKKWWERILEYSCRVAGKKGLL